MGWGGWGGVEGMGWGGVDGKGWGGRGSSIRSFAIMLALSPTNYSGRKKLSINRWVLVTAPRAQRTD
jgi:hypothetical protein